ncbi:MULTISPECIES: hypothetical protein [unclassified Anabaena]|uniref:hypothetical protein n=1 Tax=unclassified Anabaena TaxID=2619674 RepID=UPI00082E936B|nr:MULTISPECIES: hypothetical protein [unclassified Anabaena]
MKYYSINLAIVLCAIALNQSAYANPEKPLKILGEPHQAAALFTEAVTIDSTWKNAIDQSNHLQDTASSILVVQEQGCRNINPLEFLENPDAILKKCQQAANAQIPQRTEPVDYLKVPRLDSGLKLTVTKF